jgi:predicted small lipoprotein YifL
MKRLLTTALAAALAATLAACGTDAPRRGPLVLPLASTFKMGTCHDVADPVLALGAFAYRYDGAKSLPTAERRRLADTSSRLVALRADADPGLANRLTDLLTSLGFVRLRTGKTYDPQLLRDMDMARVQVQEVCIE